MAVKKEGNKKGEEKTKKAAVSVKRG